MRVYVRTPQSLADWPSWGVLQLVTFPLDGGEREALFMENGRWGTERLHDRDGDFGVNPQVWKQVYSDE